METLEARLALSAAPIAAADVFQAAYDTPLTVDAPGVLANDLDADGDTLTAIQVSGPAHGQLAWNTAGSFTYTPDAAFIGTDSFAYKASDGTTESEVASVTLQVLPVIHVGDHLLAPNQAGQIVSIYASGGFPVQGMNFNLQVADGGPEGGGVVDGPVLEHLDILTGTIFAANNTGTRDLDGEASPDIVPQYEGRGTTTVSGTEITEGLLGTVTVDTTGFSSGQWPLVMSMTLNGPSDFTVVPAVVLDGSISIEEGPDPNDPPTISDIADQATAEDTPLGPIAFTVGDLETAAGSLLVNASSDNQTLLPDANITLGGSDANRTISLAPAAGQSGTAVITVTVSDGTASASDTFLLAVTASPDPHASLPFSEDFDDGVAEYFEVRGGQWSVESDRYGVVPEFDQDAVSTVILSPALPSDLQISAIINADFATTDRLSNAFVIFDYLGPEDFKFAGAYAGADRWLIGHRTPTGWVEDAILDERIDALIDYPLGVTIEAQSRVTLTVGGIPKVSHTFPDSVLDGAIGVGTKNALTRFDDVHVAEYVPPPSAALPLSEDFADGIADFFDIRSGQWTVESEEYRVVPGTDQDGVSTVRLSEPLPEHLEISATLNADDLTAYRFSNGFIIFDYQGPSDFKFAGAYVGGDEWVIGRRTSLGWLTDVSQSEVISPWTDYRVQVILETGSHVRLLVDGAEKVSHQYADSLTDGAVGVGTRDALSGFDDVSLQAPGLTPSTTLPVSEDFTDGVAEYFDVRSGQWTVESGRYRVVPEQDQDGVSTVRLSEPLPDDVLISATFNADDLTSGRLSNGFVIFDYQGPDDFKFAGSYVSSDLWLIGRRTAAGWLTDASISQIVSPATDYNFQVVLEASGQIHLLANGIEKIAHYYADSLTDGAVGIGTRNAFCSFDDVQMQAWPDTSQTGGTDLSLDVNGDGHVTPLDSILVVNAINLGGNGGESAGTLDAATSGEIWGPDVNHDGVVSALDVLLIINHINGQYSGTGEGELPALAAPLQELAGSGRSSGAAERRTTASKPDPSTAAGRGDAADSRLGLTGSHELSRVQDGIRESEWWLPEVVDGPLFELLAADRLTL